MSSPLELRGVKKVYRRGTESVRALDGVSLRLEPGEFVAVVGPSGSGKTTLLHLAGCMDRPTGGKVFVQGQDVSEWSDAQLTPLRRTTFGFVFQQFYLIPTLTALENVELAALFSRRNGEVHKHARDLLSWVGLQERLSHRPSHLSGGEMQRVAIARALINEPKILLADEPTGNLDSQNTHGIVELLHRLRKERLLTIIVVTHNQELAYAATRTLHLRDGRFLDSD